MAVTICPDRQHRWIRSRRYVHEFKCGICKVIGVKPINVPGLRYRNTKEPWTQGHSIVVCEGIEIPVIGELNL